MNANTLDTLTFDQLVPSEGKYLRKEDFDADGEGEPELTDGVRSPNAG